MANYDALVDELANLCGLLPEYWDIFGNKHIRSVETAKAILRAMKLKIDSVEELEREIVSRKSRPWKTFLAPVHVLSVNQQPFSIPIHVPCTMGGEKNLAISWTLEDEKRKIDSSRISSDALHISEERMFDGVRYVQIDLVGEKRRDIGYYTLRVACESGGKADTLSGRSRIILTPDTCYMPSQLETGRAWGLSVNLYSVRSRRNWGVGDFKDLGTITAWTAGLKGDFVGINPLHAISNTKPFGVSPYSPISRLYRNFIYLDVDSVPEVKESTKAAKIIASKRHKQELEELRKADFVDYQRAAMLKEKILRKAFDLFTKKHHTGRTARGKAFRKYVEDEGASLESFALFMALQKYMKEKKNAYVWRQWPKEYHSVTGKAVQKFRKENEREILFYEYVQWLIEGQLGGIAGKTRKSGMCIGLYHDLAVGSIGGGSDAWSFQEVIASGVEVGAPPDDFSPDGQKWGFPSVIPERLKESGYELFIRTIRKSMKHGGAVRIDHALGMFRLFWIPEGMTPDKGAYVVYPTEDLLRIIALESARNKAMVIAEDLGTIGEHVRESLKNFGMLSYRLLYFERNYPDPSFLSPKNYPLMALCAVTTHDLPTLYGFWKGRDIEVRRAIGKYPDEALWNKQLEERERDKGLIIAALKAEGILPDDYPSDPASTPEMTPELCRAIYHYLALTPCKLLLASLDDVIGALNQQNMPGTVDSQPNWVQKTPLRLEEIVKDKRFIELSQMLNKYVVS